MSIPFLLLWLIPLIFGIWAFGSGRRDLQYPAVMAWLYLAWIVPQAISIEKSPLKDIYGTHFVWLYATCAFIAGSAGFYLAKNAGKKKRRRQKPMEFDYKRLTIASGALIALGIVSLLLTIRTVQAQSLGSSWTGIATAYYLLAQSAYLGLAIAAILFVRKPSYVLAAIIVVGLLGVMPAVVTLVKRNVLFELGVIAAGSLYFGRRVVPPRLLVFGAMIFGTILLHQVATVRHFVQADKGNVADAIVEGVPFENFAYFELDRAPELSKAVVDIYVARQTGQYEWGAEYVNKLTHQYVPSFLLGREFKDSLKLDTRSGLDELAVEDFESRGATRTGFSDSYRSFQEFGLIIFFLIGSIMGWLYGRAVEGSLIAQFFYVILLNDSLFAITESTARFISQLPFILVMAFAVFFFARKRVRRRPVMIHPQQPGGRRPATAYRS